MEAHAAPRGEEVRVSTLELFFDLVFVFALTQLTAVLADRFEGVLVVGLLPWRRRARRAGDVLGPVERRPRLAFLALASIPLGTEIEGRRTDAVGRTQTASGSI